MQTARRFWQPHQYIAWVLGISTGIAVAAVGTYYRAEQIPGIQSSLEQLNATMAKVNQRLDDSQRERDRMQREIDHLGSCGR